MPQRLEKVEHVVALLVEELAHKGGASAGGGQEEDVLLFGFVKGLMGAVVFQAAFHEGEDRSAGPLAEVEGEGSVGLEQELEGGVHDHRRLLQGEFVRHPGTTRADY